MIQKEVDHNWQRWTDVLRTLTMLFLLAVEARECQETIRTEALMQWWLACPYSLTNLYSDARVRVTLVDGAAELRKQEHRTPSVNCGYWHHDLRLARQTLATFIFSQHLQPVIARPIVVKTILGFGGFAWLHRDFTRPPVNIKSTQMKYKAQTVNHPPER